MQRTVLYFTGPRQVEARVEALEGPGDHQVLVQTLLSGISAGTEMLFYRGEQRLDSDAEADRISRGLSYPAPYGYCAVGRVTDVGRHVNSDWLDRLVFAFQPHASHFVAPPDDLLIVPQGVAAEDAIFVANTETAVSLVQDAGPLLGERVLVLGQGVVGLLTAALLHGFPLDVLVTVDRFGIRRAASEAIGVAMVLDPARPDFRSEALAQTGIAHQGYDAVIELTGSPSALDAAVALTAFSGRVIVGSWYGTKSVSLDLGGRFHRSRIRLVSSQVSTIAPELSGRWNKERRFLTAWDALKRVSPAHWITQRFPIERASEAYALLDGSPEDTIQVALQYS